MKKFHLFSLFLLFINAGYAADKVIDLNKPNPNRSTTTLTKALSDRKSTREFAAKELSKADLSDLLWAANGINRPGDNKRTAPSAMNRQSVDVYVIFPQGAYLYDAKANKLNLVAEGDFRDAIAASQDYVKTAPAVVLLVSDYSKMGDPKQELVRMMGAVDAGVISQNISLFCATANMATVPRAYMDKDKLKTALKLKDSQVPILNHPVGYFK